MMARLPTAIVLLLVTLRRADSLLHYQKLRVNCRKESGNARLQMRLNPSSFEGTSFTITEFPRPSLRRVPNAPIADFDDSLRTKASEMFTVMYGAPGVGLAAPQVGLNELLFVYNPTGDKESKNMERIVTNPTITKYADETDVEEEGCLSLRSDECAGRVRRSTWIEVEYQNELGQKVRRRLKGFEARVFQHEYDHLMGILAWDRYPPEDRDKVRANIDKLLGRYKGDDAIVEADPDMLGAMQPPAMLTAGRMPPLDVEEAGAAEAPTATTAAKGKKKKGSSTSGFGSPGGFGGGAKKGVRKKKGKK